MKTIKKSIEIPASKEKVWPVLLDDAYTRDWYTVFGPGIHAESDWIEGHKIVFKDNKNCGMSGIVAVKHPYEELVFIFDGIVKDGQADTESNMAKAVAGAKEAYYLTGTNGTSTLTIECDTDEAH